MPSLLDDILGRLGALPEAERSALAQEVMQATGDMLWCPNPGPQTAAYESLADELFYGGQAGGGKSDLLVGLSLNKHRRSLVLRRTNKEADKLVERFAGVIGNRDGWNSQRGIWRRPNGAIIDIGGCQLEDDKQKYKGDPHDLIGFDEITDFTESQYVFITIWNRSVDPHQRCRVVCTGNPPTTPEGLWVVRRWAAWLDPNHPNPAADGELRWYRMTEDGREVECDGPGPYPLGGEMVRARSRTFIRAKLSDNPDLAATNYDATLAALEPELREAYRDGRFDVSLKDDAFQVFPSSWLRAAQARWTPDGFRGSAMTAMALDPAGGGRDDAVIAPRYGGWFAPLIVAHGPETADGSSMAALVVKNRKDGCPVVVDMGGGYAGAVKLRLFDNGIECVAFNGAAKSAAKSKVSNHSFANKRAEAHWRFREELDPDQEGGSAIALPPDPELIADLASVHWTLTAHGIQIEDKDDIRKRIGRSPGRGDAVVMALHGGNLAASRRVSGYGSMMGHAPVVVMQKPRGLR